MNNVEIYINGSYRCVASKGTDLRYFLKENEINIIIDKIYIIKNLFKYIQEMINNKYYITESRLDCIELLCIDLISNGKFLVIIDIYI